MAIAKKTPVGKAKTSLKKGVSVAVKKVTLKETNVIKKDQSLTAPVFTPDGNSKGRESLPKEVFGVATNLQIIAQAVRVYRANQREGSASTKTRGEVEGSTRKIYKQKGTGRARHGGIRAPIFVGGGIVFGPRTRDYGKQMPQGMRVAALVSALSYQQKEGHVIVIEQTNEAAPKTAIVAKGLTSMGVTIPMLMVVHDSHTPFIKAIRNITGVTIVPAKQITTYDVVTHKTVCLTKESIEILIKRI